MNIQFFTFIIFVVIFNIGVLTSIPVIKLKIIKDAILVQWNFTGHVTGTIQKYRVTYAILPDPDVTSIVIDDVNTDFALIATKNHPGRLYNISVQAETERGLVQHHGSSRFTRADCGGRIFIMPGTSVSIESPHYPDMYERGVFCKWSIYTNSSYAISYYLTSINFGQNDSDCSTSYLSVVSSQLSSTRQYLCKNQTMEETRLSSLDFIFQSGVVTKGNGFQMILKSVVKQPGSPSNIVMKAVRRGISLYWSEPEGSYQPITSYTLSYTSLPDVITHRLKLSQHMNRYIINTKGHEGQMFVINITAYVGEKAGISARLFFRAPCVYSIIISSQRTSNITTPLYPNSYPRGISCMWNLQSEHGEDIEIRILDMDIEDDVFCSSDYLLISSQTEKLCGKLMYPKIIRSHSGKVDIKFYSDGDKTGRGFFIQAKVLETTTVTLPTSTVHISKSTTALTQAFTRRLHNIPLLTSTTLPNNAIDNAGTTSTQPSPSETGNVLYTESTYSHGDIDVTTKGVSNKSRTTTDATTTSVYTPETTITNTYSPETTIDNAYTPETTIPNAFSSEATTTSAYTPEAAMASTTTITSTLEAITTSKLNKTINHSIFSTLEPVTNEMNIDSVYFVPHLHNVTHPVHFNLTLKRRTGLHNNADSNLKKDVLSKLLVVFNDTDMFNSLVINTIQFNSSDKSAQVQFTVNYNLTSLLGQYQRDSSFRLIDHINKTNLQQLSSDGDISDNWTIEDNYLRTFRIYDFAEQEVESPCDTIQAICRNNYTCVRMNTSSVGVVCCHACSTKILPNCESNGGEICKSNTHTTSITTPGGVRTKSDNSKTDIIIVITAVVSGVTVVSVIVVLALRKRRKCTTMDVKGSERRVCIEMHDILLQSNYIGDKNVQFTAFKLGRKRSIGGSLPTRRLDRYKLDEDMETKLKQLGLFIEDKDTLVKRLRLKNARRRGNSL